MREIFRKYFVLVILLFGVFYIVNIICPDSQRKIFIDGDGSGHYAYLPTLIIYKTVDFTQVFEFEKQRRPADYMGHYFQEHDGIYINKYTAGTAFLQLPFFIIAYMLSIIFGFPADGYNIIFQYASAFSALFWLTIGIYFFVKLQQLYKIGKLSSWLMAFVLLFGTNLFFYTFVQPSFSHVYSFALISVFLYFAKIVIAKPQTKYLITAVFVLGLIFLVRPVNIIIVGALPFIAGSSCKFNNIIKFNLKNFRLFYAIIAFIVATSPQLIINYLQTGSVLVYGYENEGFNFLHPHLYDILFSYRKGWFVYTPLFLLLFPSLFYFGKKSRYFELSAFALFFIFIIYLFSSWWNWFYGDSFGMRPMVDYYSLFFLVIAIFITNIHHKWVKIAATIFVFAAIIINQIQTYQYAKGIIHADSMTQEAYWYVFLKTNCSYSGVISGGSEYYNGTIDKKPYFSSKNSIDSFSNNWNKSSCIDSTYSLSDKSVKLNTNCIYSPAFQRKLNDSLIGYKNIYIKFYTDYLEPTKDAALGAVFVVDIGDDNHHNIFYKAFNIKKLPNNTTNKWIMGEIGFKLPEITKEMSYIKLYIWNVEKKSFYLDNLNVEFYTYK